uniref:Mediator of RNA polymerase II transcription subunit 12-like n=1 Tax=Cucumis melo TaxID=3656 RepID=A0A9I9CKH0_CUCME
MVSGSLQNVLLMFLFQCSFEGGIAGEPGFEAHGSWRDQFCVTRSATHVVSRYRYMFDLFQLDQQFDMVVTQEYIHWYNNIMRLYITRPGATVGHLRSNNIRLRDVADDPQQALDICNNNESPMTMMPTFGAGYCDSEVGTGYYDAGVGPTSSYMDVGLLTSYMHGHRRGYGEHNEYLYHEAPAMYQIDKSINKNQRTKRIKNNIEFRVDVDNQLKIDDVQVVEHIDFLLSIK